MWHQGSCLSMEWLSSSLNPEERPRLVAVAVGEEAVPTEDLGTLRSQSYMEL